MSENYFRVELAHEFVNDVLFREDDETHMWNYAYSMSYVLMCAAKVTVDSKADTVDAGLHLGSWNSGEWEPGFQEQAPEINPIYVD